LAPSVPGFERINHYSTQSDDESAKDFYGKYSYRGNLLPLCALITMQHSHNHCRRALFHGAPMLAWRLKMKRTFLFLLIVLCFSLPACTSITPQPEIDIIPPAPISTITVQEHVVELATPTVESIATEAPSKPTPTEAATETLAPMPPLNAGGWYRVGEGLPFTFELPDGWITPDGFIKGAPYWVPAGITPEQGQMVFAVNEAEMVGDQVPQTWPQNSAVESRTTIEANGASYEMVEVKVFNGEGGTCNAYEAHVMIPISGDNKVYGLYVTASTKEDRDALEDILVHAVQSLTF
jgi:hypothetical protein